MSLEKVLLLEEKGKGEFIMEFEIGLSRVILDNDYEITSFQQSDNNYKEL